MSTKFAEFPATTDAPLLDSIATRWSTRAFDPQGSVNEADLDAILEAARWAPSAFNSQPWRFVVGLRGSETFHAITQTLTSFNLEWAPRAAVLLVAITTTRTEDGKALPTAEYDTGQAIALANIQAVELGYAAHQMSGFDTQAFAEAFSLPENQKALTVTAIGPAGDPAALSETLQKRQGASRVRKTREELTIASDR